LRLPIVRTCVVAILVGPCLLMAGCSQPDNPKMPDVAPVEIKKDTTPPPTQGSQQYGASKKYQDSMPK